jgi:hypothetical protein
LNPAARESDMKHPEINPFSNESESLQLGDLTIENRVDRVSIYGSIDLTLDKAGLELAKQLKSILDLTVAKLEKSDLPESVAMIESDTVKNPFD